MTKEKTYFIYVRSTGEKVPVTKEQHDSFYPYQMLEFANMRLADYSTPRISYVLKAMDLTVLKVIQAAGGLRPFANKRNVQVTRGEKDGTFVKTTVDLVEIGEEGKAYKDMKLKAGDVVYVRETYW